MPGSDTDATCTRLTCSGPGKTTGLEPADSQWPLAWRGRSWRFQAESHQEFSTRKEPLCSLPTSETSLFLSLLPLLAFQWNCQKKQAANDDGWRVTPPNQTGGVALMRTLTQTVNRQSFNCDTRDNAVNVRVKHSYIFNSPDSLPMKLIRFLI